MEILRRLLLGAAALPVCLFARESADSVPSGLELDEIVVVSDRPVLKQESDRIVYLIKNDPYASGLDGMEVLDRIPRVSVVDNHVSVAGKSSVRYIIDGRLLEMPYEAIAMRLKNMQSSCIRKIEVLTSPPSKYAAGADVAYISITTRDESLGTRGSIRGSLAIREDPGLQFGGNLSHSGPKVELSADAGWKHIKGINDLERVYTFSDHIRTSARTNRITDRMSVVNGLFRYKFTPGFSAGTAASFSATRFKSTLRDETTDNGTVSFSDNMSPGRPDNALTLTAFGDWMPGSDGKLLSITYNFFSRHTKSFSDISTVRIGEEQTRMTDDASNRYRIHSVKIDAAIPLPSFRLETGAAYTGIDNNTALRVRNLTDGVWTDNIRQSNTFDYNEKTAAVYVSAQSNFSGPFSGRLGLRYEHTYVRGCQPAGDMSHDRSYGYLFPSLNLGWNSPEAGRMALSYSMGISRPGFKDLNPFRYYTTVSDYFSGNPDLAPVISHNAEISYAFKGLYAVIYNSYNIDAVGAITRFNADGSQYTLPENCLDTDKAGLYLSYSRRIAVWWSLTLGGEVFHSFARAKTEDFRDSDDRCWSGKLELNTSWMLNRQKTLVLNLRFSHYFPWRDRMTRYSAISLMGCDLRYSLPGNRLNVAVSVNDPFGWNITRSRGCYSGYIVDTCNDIHSHSVMLSVSLSLGRDKVRNVWRDTKERESRRSD